MKKFLLLSLLLSVSSMISAHNSCVDHEDEETCHCSCADDHDEDHNDHEGHNGVKKHRVSCDGDEETCDCDEN